MALTATADLIMSAAVNGAAVPAFNAITLEHAEGIAAGVERSGAAALIQISENTIRFHGGRMAPLVSACARIAEGSDDEQDGKEDTKTDGETSEKTALFNTTGQRKMDDLLFGNMYNQGATG